jgi:hypothetical protein
MILKIYLNNFNIVFKFSFFPIVMDFNYTYFDKKCQIHDLKIE